MPSDPSNRNTDRTRVTTVRGCKTCCMRGASQVNAILSEFVDQFFQTREDQSLAYASPAIVRPAPPTLPGTGPATFTPPEVIRIPAGKALPVGAVLIATGVTIDLILKSIGAAELEEVMRQMIGVAVDVLSNAFGDCRRCCDERALQQDNPRYRLETANGPIYPRL